MSIISVPLSFSSRLLADAQTFLIKFFGKPLKGSYDSALAKYMNSLKERTMDNQGANLLFEIDKAYEDSFDVCAI